MRAVADKDGKVWVDVQITPETSARFAIGGMDGDQFAPGLVVEIDDARLEGVKAKLLGSFGAQTVPIEATPQ